MTVIEREVVEEVIETTEISDDEISELCEKAADILEKVGLCQGTFEDLDGKVCLYGALNVILYGQASPPFFSAKWKGNKHLIAHFAKRLGFKSPDHTVAWNDAPGRTKEEVVRRLREASAKGA